MAGTSPAMTLSKWFDMTGTRPQPPSSLPIKFVGPALNLWAASERLTAIGPFAGSAGVGVAYLLDVWAGARPRPRDPRGPALKEHSHGIWKWSYPSGTCGDMVQRGYVNDCTDPWVKQSFGPGMMLAISSEETEFRNIRQTHARMTCGSSAGRAQGRHPTATTPAITQSHSSRSNDTIGMWLLFNSELCMGLP
jgi:hypothetical protein